MVSEAEDAWVAEIGLLDHECPAEGTLTTVTLHRTRDGAVRAVQDHLAEADIPAGIREQVAEQLAGHEAVFGDFLEPGEEQFEWTWQIFVCPIEE